MRLFGALLFSALLALPAAALEPKAPPAEVVDAFDESGDAPDEAPAEGLVEAEADDSDDAEPLVAEDSEDESAADGEEDAESESAEAQAAALDPSILYSTDLSDEELARRWKEEPETLGSITLGFTDAGRVINAVQFPQGPHWTVVDPRNTWGTQETVDFVAAAIEAVVAEFPDSPKLRVNHISSKEGGYLRPHRSHQAGRDVDLAFYYKPGHSLDRRRPEQSIDLARNWALVRALVTMTDVHLVLVDQRVINALYQHALEAGEDKAWLDSIFRSGRDSIVRHARRHRDHFHVRFYNPRAQELGRRVQPLLSERPDLNRTVHRIRRGDTLGHIAKRYGTTVTAIRKVNPGLNPKALRPGRTISVPVRGQCVRCPAPPPLVVPARRLPPERLAVVDTDVEETVVEETAAVESSGGVEQRPAGEGVSTTRSLR